MSIQIGLFIRIFDVIGSCVESILLNVVLFACLCGAYTFDNVVMVNVALC